MSEEAMKANQAVQVHTHQQKKNAAFFFFVHWLSDPRLAATQSLSASDVGDYGTTLLEPDGNEPDKAGS